jgi:uncharacterized phage protein (TIGR02218 family)
MQKFCRHSVYDTSCKVDENDFALSVVPSAIDTGFLTVTCPGAEAFADGWFSGGMLKMPSGALRYIVTHTANQISLWRPEPSIVDILDDEESELVLYPGCDGSLNTCYTKFNNTLNNGAFYWIPSINPVGGSSVF